MDDTDMLRDFLQKSNKFAPSGLGQRVVASPIPPTSLSTPPATTTTTTTTAAAAADAAAVNNTMPRSYRRISAPTQYYPSSTTGTTYSGRYNNYPFRPYVNMGGYNTYNSYGQPVNNQYQNPVVIAAAENSRPAFESIHSVVQSFNAVSMMLESTFTAMHMSFQALLGVAENFTRLRMFMMKLYSTIVTFKLARWFLTKLFYLLRLVRGGKKSTAEEELWASLSSTVQKEVIPSDGRSWPLVVFTGLLVATPYFVYKLLNSVTPASNPLPRNFATDVANRTTSTQSIIIKAQHDWEDSYPTTIPVVKGQLYKTTQSRLIDARNSNGWLHVEDVNGQIGLVPLWVFKPHKIAISHPPQQTVIPEMSNTAPNMLSLGPEQLQPNMYNTPIIDIHNPIILPHMVDFDKFGHGQMH